MISSTPLVLFSLLLSFVPPFCSPMCLPKNPGWVESSSNASHSLHYDLPFEAAAEVGILEVGVVESGGSGDSSVGGEIVERDRRQYQEERESAGDMLMRSYKGERVLGEGGGNLLET